MELPASAEVVIVGGGVMGVSTAFHLAEAGVPDVVLLERDDLGSGSTSKAAGGVRAQFSDALNIQLGARSLEAFERFGERPGYEIDLSQPGYLFLLSTSDDLAVFEQSVALQNELGVPSRMITAAEAHQLSPWIETDDVLGAAFSPTDGHCTPESVVLGYAMAARRLGARVVPHCAVLGIELGGSDGRQVQAVVTHERRIETSTVICTAGAWSRHVGEMAGVDLPVEPYRRQIVVTEPVADLPPRLPMTIDFTSTFYFHREGPGLLMGMTDPDETAGFKLDRSDDWLPRLTAAIGHRAPRILDIGLSSGWAGLYEVTPDHNAIIGESPEAGRFLYATGFSGHGFLMGPAVGEVLRDLYLGRQPFVDVSPLDVHRFATSGLRPEVNCI
jgi:sarcosine oxidase, subunit beta